MRAGMVLPVEEHNQLLTDYLAAAAREERPLRDNCRVIISGAFCEQPPLNLIKSIELAGCHIVDDDYMLVNRWLLEDVSVTGDPLLNLALAFLHESADTAAKYCVSDEEVGKQLVESVRHYKAEGVIFSAASFCDPALLERPMLVDKLAEQDVPYIAFKYAENSGQMQPIREQAGTFADSIKLWS
jgi:benzoyl-CoA reductase subunit C